MTENEVSIPSSMPYHPGGLSKLPFNLGHEAIITSQIVMQTYFRIRALNPRIVYLIIFILQVGAHTRWEHAHKLCILQPYFQTRKSFLCLLSSISLLLGLGEWISSNVNIVLRPARRAFYAAINGSENCITSSLIIINQLTHWGLVMPFGDIDLGQHWLR